MGVTMFAGKAGVLLNAFYEEMLRVLCRIILQGVK
jgi:hypothetical protein